MRKECLREWKATMGAPWNPHHDRLFIPERGEEERTARALHRRLCAAIDAVVAFGRSNEVGEACAASLRLLASLERVGEHAPIHQHPIVLRREWPESHHSRAALVALIDQRNILRMPADQARDGEFSDRALALASLLCGFFPGVGLTATIADVIDQERKAVRAARLRIRGRRTPQRPKRAPP